MEIVNVKLFYILLSCVLDYVRFVRKGYDAMLVM